MSDFDQKNGSQSQDNQQDQTSRSYESDSTGQGPYPSYTKKGHEQDTVNHQNTNQFDADDSVTPVQVISPIVLHRTFIFFTSSVGLFSMYSQSAKSVPSLANTFLLWEK